MATTDLWTFPAVWDAVAAAVPHRIALRHADRAVDWSTFVRRAHGLARAFLGAGLGGQAKVALYLHNAPEYMETVHAALMAGCVPVNTNYRYVESELLYLWTNADAEAVVFHGAFTGRIEAVRGRCPMIRLWLHVDDGSGPCPPWATPYETAAATPGAPVASRCDGEGLILIYTGGTTGLPRGVMWRQHDLYLASNTTGDPETADFAHVAARVSSAARPPVGLSAPPLMHGTAFVFSATILNRGGTLVTLPGPFDAVAVLDAIAAHRVTDLCIVGDAFCRPIVEHLERDPSRHDLSSLQVVASSGMAWSPDVKERLLVHAPQCLLVDFLNASEASGLGRSLTSTRAPAAGATFKLGKTAFVIRDDGSEVVPGSGEIGRIAVRGRVPLGYYKDPAKSAATFPVIGGVRCGVPGDYATVAADGSITLLGRGSVSINTGGEKVFPDEVEAALKTHPSVRDAVVLGIPDARLGEVVGAVVEAVDSATVDPDALAAHIHGAVARYKVPRHVMVVPTIGRGPNGKADYPALRQRLVAWVQSRSEVPPHA